MEQDLSKPGCYFFLAMFSIFHFNRLSKMINSFGRTTEKKLSIRVPCSDSDGMKRELMVNWRTKHNAVLLLLSPTKEALPFIQNWMHWPVSSSKGRLVLLSSIRFILSNYPHTCESVNESLLCVTWCGNGMQQNGNINTTKQAIQIEFLCPA